jgi:outer membrane protein assembly factor BamD
MSGTPEPTAPVWGRMLIFALLSRMPRLLPTTRLAPTRWAALSVRPFRAKAAFVCLLVMALAGASCSGYEQLLKSDDFDLKYEKAREYYNRGSYNRALPLFKQLLTVEKGTEREEELMYYIAYSHYGQGEYLLAAALFKNYYTFFPRTSRTAECHYMSAYCNYLSSPRVTLDQTTTYKAIDAFQLFINAHPQSDSVSAANRMIDVLRDKLERKALNAAELYDRTGNHQAAAVTYREVLRDFPDIDNADRIQYEVMRSWMDYADRSVVCKKAERYDEALDAWADLSDRYPESRWTDPAARLRERALADRDGAREDCRDQERARAFLTAEVADRNRDHERAARLWEAFLNRYPEADRRDEAEVGLIRARLGLARDAASPCAAEERYARALERYHAFAEGATTRAVEETWLDQAQKLYDDILEGQDEAKKQCHEFD